MNNLSQNNFNNDDNLSQATVTQAAVMHTPVTYNNNVGQQPMSNVASNNNVTMSNSISPPQFLSTIY